MDVSTRGLPRRSRTRGATGTGGISAAERRIVAAFAEVMAPGTDRLPAAERDVPVAANVAEMSRLLPRRPLRLMRLGIHLFDRLVAPPRRFSHRSLTERRRCLERLATSRSPVRRELLMLMKTLVATNYCRDERVRVAVGYEARCEVDGPDPPETPPLGSLEPEGDGEDCDVAIVGSGAGGAAAAVALAEAGLDVLVLEAGPHLDRSAYPEDPIDVGRLLYRDAGATFAEGLPLVPVPMGRAVGGTTVINSGTCFRTPEPILRRWSEHHGIRWALELDELFEDAERMLAIEAIPEGRIGRNGELVAAGAAAIGARGAPLRRNAGRCVQCSSCPQGCRLDAKRAMHVSYLPRAVSAGARIRRGVEARRVILESGRARGLECVAGEDPSTRRRFTVRARRGVVSAGGAFGTPELMLRSGLEGPRIGRNLHLHPSAWIGARFDEPVRGWEGVMQSYGVEQWAGEGIMLEATFTPLAYGGHWLPGVGATHAERLAAFDRLGSNGVQVRDGRSVGRVRLARDGTTRASYRLHRSDARKIVFGIARAAEIWFAAGAREVYPQVSGNPVLGPGDVAAFESSPPPTRDLRVESFHPMGTMALDADPGRGASAPDGSVRGARDLYVADASLLPTALGVNPMVTIIACAGRIGRDMAERLG